MWETVIGWFLKGPLDRIFSTVDNAINNETTRENPRAGQGRSREVLPLVSSRYFNRSRMVVPTTVHRASRLLVCCCMHLFSPLVQGMRLSTVVDDCCASLPTGSMDGSHLWLAVHRQSWRRKLSRDLSGRAMRSGKDIRIQLLENQLTESYDKRVLAADRLAEAIHSTRTALEALTSEIRAKR